MCSASRAHPMDTYDRLTLGAVWWRIKGSQRRDIVKAREYWRSVREYLRKGGGESGAYKKL